ncbi:MAG: hypothetical protein ACR2NA_06260 [Solirubrobacterales bacterium]
MAQATDTRRRRLEEIDGQVDELKSDYEEALNDALEGYDEALAEVASRPEIDESIQQRLSSVSKRLADLKPKLDAADLTVRQQAAIYSAIVDLSSGLTKREADLDRFEKALIGIERIRHVIRDALDEFIGGVNADRQQTVRELASELAGVRRSQVADLVGVDPRTLSRWQQRPGEKCSSRLRLVARLVAVLRHAWTPAGVVAWFSRPRRGLGGKKPIDLLDDPAYEQELLSAARGSRTQYST